MKKKRKILVFGYFGYVTNQLDGQTVKTRAVYKLIEERANANVIFADSQEFRKNPISIIKFLHNLVSCNTLIWLPAHNNLKYLFPLIWYASLLFRFDIIYIVIGGWLSRILESLPFHCKKLSRIRAILVENRLTVKELSEKYHYTNLYVIPNFRSPVSKPEFRIADKTLRVVFMARINLLKGLDTIAEVCQSLAQNVTIDFYGPINPPDKEYFYQNIIEKYPFVGYQGIISPDDIHTTLQKYDVMILPTHYFTEGFPGSILDAYRAGIPVIVTKWKHATEFVEDGVSGFIVNFENPTSEIIDKINTLASNEIILRQMKTNAFSESEKYTPEVAWDAISPLLLN